MEEFVVTVAAAAVLCMVLELLVPKSGLKNTVRFAIGLLFMALMLTAVHQLIQQTLVVPISWESTQRTQQKDVTNSQEQLIQNLYEQAREQLLLEEGRDRE